MAKVTDVARYIIKNCNVGNLKLQKLLYYSQAVYMVLHDGTPLFEEKIEAWDYGPVVPEIYQVYKHYGFESIPQSEIGDSPVNLTLEDIEAIDMVLAYYGDMSAVALVAKTHSESPWKDVYKPNTLHIEITKESIYGYFKENLQITDN